MGSNVAGYHLFTWPQPVCEQSILFVSWFDVCFAGAMLYAMGLLKGPACNKCFSVNPYNPLSLV